MKKHLLFLILCFLFVIGKQAQSQNTCLTPVNLNYSQTYPDYHAFVFTDTAIWIMFTGDSTGIAYLNIESDTSLDGAMLKNLIAYKGPCSNLQEIYSKTYTSNDSLSVSLDSVVYGQTYFIYLEREIQNNCTTCDTNVWICLTNMSANTHDLVVFNECNYGCVSLNSIINGDFNLGNSGFTSQYQYWSTGTSTSKKYVVSENSNNFIPGSYFAHGYDVNIQHDKFLMCDMYCCSYESPLPYIWSETVVNLTQNENYIFKFYTLNLDDASQGAGLPDPRIEVDINGVIIPHSNISYIPSNTEPSNYVDIPNDETWHPICYNWNSGNANTAIIKIRQLPYNYSTIHGYMNGHDLGIDHIEWRLVKDPPAITTQSPTICAGELVDIGSSAYLSVTPNSQNYTYVWSNLANSQEGNASNPVSPINTTVYYLTVIDQGGCYSTAQITVYVASNIPDFAISGYNNNCTETTTYTASISDPTYSYTWTILCPTGASCGSIQSQTLNTVTVTWDQTSNFSPTSTKLKLVISNGYCSKSFEYTIFKCCLETTSNTFANMTLDTKNYTNNDLYFQGDIFIEGTTTIEGSGTVFMGPLSRIIINPDAILEVSGDIHFKQLCGFMWDGIYAATPDASISFQNNTIGQPKVTDAINGIVSMNGGHLSITNTEFDNNYNSITLENYFTNHPDYYGSLDVSIAGCHFDNLGDQTYPNRITFPPYQNILPNAGILLQSIDAVIGDNQRATNTFENLQRGIYAITSHAQVLNADFTDIPPANGYQYSWPYRQAGILATGNDNDSPVDPILIAGNFEKALNFTNCKVGIATQKL